MGNYYRIGTIAFVFSIIVYITEIYKNVFTSEKVGEQKELVTNVIDNNKVDEQKVINEKNNKLIEKDNVSKTESPIGHNVNPNYGFTKDGIFYINKILIERANFETAYLKSDLTNWNKGEIMTLDGDFYVYKANIDEPYDNETKITYCFNNGSGIHLPTLLLSRNSSLIDKKDVTINPSNSGYNFKTNPQIYYPGRNN